MSFTMYYDSEVIELDSQNQPPRQCVACGRQFGWDMNVCPYCGKDYRQQVYGPQPMQQIAPQPPVNKGSVAGAGVGILGSVMILIGIFLPWAGAGAFGFSISFSGWDLNSMSTSLGTGALWEVTALLGLGVLCMILSIIEAVTAKAPGAIVLVFGIISILVTILVFNELSPILSIPGAFIGFGVYVCIIGSIIATIGGAIGVAHHTRAPMQTMPMQPLR